MEYIRRNELKFRSEFLFDIDFFNKMKEIGDRLFIIMGEKSHRKNLLDTINCISFSYLVIDGETSKEEFERRTKEDQEKRKIAKEEFGKICERFSKEHIPWLEKTEKEIKEMIKPYLSNLDLI